MTVSTGEAVPRLCREIGTSSLSTRVFETLSRERRMAGKPAAISGGGESSGKSRLNQMSPGFPLYPAGAGPATLAAVGASQYENEEKGVVS